MAVPARGPHPDRERLAPGGLVACEPVPPVASKQKEVRYVHIHEDDELDEKQFAAWVRQASNLPGEKM